MHIHMHRLSAAVVGFSLHNEAPIYKLAGALRSYGPLSLSLYIYIYMYVCIYIYIYICMYTYTY